MTALNFRTLRPRIPGWCYNRYAIATLVIIGYVGFFDSNSLLKRWQMQKELDRLEDERDYYRREIVKTETTYRDLFSDPTRLEKFAREQYLMKKEGEEIFIIERVD